MSTAMKQELVGPRTIRKGKDYDSKADFQLWQGKVEDFLSVLEARRSGPIFDLVVTSPPYNIGKEYEQRSPLDQYIDWQRDIINRIHPFVKDAGSVCWQVGNYVENGSIMPLDIEIAPVFKELEMKLRNRIVWRYGHGLHAQRRFSGRYEVVLWYTKTDDYTFDLDPVRVPAKYPGKRHFQGPKKGEYSGNKKGKNPEDVWDKNYDEEWDAIHDLWEHIPNVKANHVEKTDHPCQFPVGLVSRLVLSMTKPGDLVFDPFSGVASSGVSAALHGRRYIGCELVSEYNKIGARRITDAIQGNARVRPHDRPIMSPEGSNLSKRED